MAREFAKKFYQSKQWRQMRQYMFSRAYGQCEKCGGVSNLVVHHKIKLTPNNINDTNISLNENNLILLCSFVMPKPMVTQVL
jgi:5-methylcytosine-specific restriction enzyme A